MKFQECYNLFVDEKLNNDTLQLMNRTRCFKEDSTFSIATKQNKTYLTWYFYQANKNYLELGKKTFSMLEENSNWKFSNILKPMPVKPDIFPKMRVLF